MDSKFNRDIFLNNPFEKPTFHKIDEYKAKLLTTEYAGYLNTYDIYIEEKDISDYPDIPQILTFLYAIETAGDNAPFEIKIYEERPEPFFNLVCEIKEITLEKQGLIQFKAYTFFEGSRDESFDKNFLNNVYICIRDVYHEHTHHDGDHNQAADSLTKLVFDKPEKESIIEIVKNFQRKIVDYHKIVKGLLKSTGNT